MTIARTWWVRGVSLTERLPAHSGSGGSPAGGTQHWRDDYESEALFHRRLDDLGLDERGLGALLAEAPEQLAARLERPSWADTAQRALRAAPTAAPAPVAGLSWEEGFATVLAPFTLTAAERLLHAAEQRAAGAPADPGALRRCFTEQLAAVLVRLARRTLVLELNVLRVRGALDGATPELRFADFVRRTASRAGLGALLTEYPVLARLLAQACEHAVDAWSELLVRLAEDRAALVETVFAGRDPGLLAEVRAGAGDRHRRGRAVAVLSFEHGDRVVLKPRPLAAHRHFNEAVHWLNSRLPDLDLRTLTVLERPGYGWVEHAAASPCTDDAQVGRFYRRFGALLALAHTLGGTDFHFENLIACADQPVLVDLETLFHPTLERPSEDLLDPARVLLTDSVYRTALLPVLLVGDHGAVDLSALGGDPDAPLPDPVTGWSAPATDEMQLIRTTGVFRPADNRPRLNGADADPAVHTEALLAGFRAGYDAIAAGRDRLAGLLAGSAADETRVVLRHTRQYTALLDESTHPDLLRDAVDRDRLLDLLWRDSAGDPLLRALVDAELADLWAGDVPLVTGRPAERRLRLGRTTVADAVAESGHDWVRRRLAAMGRTDRYDQEWVIRAALAVRKGEGDHRLAVTPPGPASATIPDQERLLTAACGIADQILAGAQDDGRRVNWLGLEPLEDDLHWALLPQGAGLPHGYCGTALFLAQLADLTGVERYADVARRALTPIPALLTALGRQPAELPFVGTGFGGLGGIAYALALLSGLLDDPDLSSWAATAVDLAATAAGTGTDPGVLHGDAGCLAAMLAVHRTTGLPAAWDTARVGARRLLARPVDDLSTGGFTDGTPGIGWALLRFAHAGGGPEFAEAGLDRLRAAAAHWSPDRVRDSRAGWCAGPGGLALALADSGAADADPRLATLLDTVTTAAARHWVTADHSLCHGETGLLELLLAAAAAGRTAPGAALPRGGALLAALDRFGPRCATPATLSSPGLLSGLAGIGHGLLRLGFGDRVPSVLLLQPPGPAGGRRVHAARTATTGGTS